MKRFNEGDRVSLKGFPEQLGTVRMIDRRQAPHHIAVDWDGKPHLDWCTRFELNKRQGKVESK